MNKDKEGEYMIFARAYVLLMLTLVLALVANVIIRVYQSAPALLLITVWMGVSGARSAIRYYNKIKERR